MQVFIIFLLLSSDAVCNPLGRTPGAVYNTFRKEKLQVSENISSKQRHKTETKEKNGKDYL